MVWKASYLLALPTAPPGVRPAARLALRNTAW